MTLRSPVSSLRPAGGSEGDVRAPFRLARRAARLGTARGASGSRASVCRDIRPVTYRQFREWFGSRILGTDAAKELFQELDLPSPSRWNRGRACGCFPNTTST